MKREKLFLWICRLAGVNIFKKYWPMEGSYWNKEKLNGNNPADMKEIINRADNHTREHVQYLLTGMLFIILNGISGYIKRRKVIRAIPVILFYHGYGFMVQHYNRILARRQLKLLESSKDEEKDEDSPITINSYQNLYHLSIEPINLGPNFISEDKAISFRGFVYHKLGTDRECLLEKCYLGGYKELYQEWKSIISV